MNQKLQNMCFTFLAAIVIVPLYIFLHESGHALVSLSCGARITAFSIFGAYTSSEGGNYNDLTYSLLHVAGVLLPILVSIGVLLFYRKDRLHAFYRITMFLVGMLSIGSACAWVIVPILYLQGKAPVADDVTKFIEASGVAPLLVIACAALVMGVFLLILWKKQVIQNWWQTIQGK